MIIFAHLLNDRSGSPKVLASAISALCAGGESARLFVGSDGAGCLDEAGIPITRYWYKRGSHRSITLFTFFFSQWCLFWRLLFTRGLPRDTVMYVNTLLPFGAAIYGVLTRRTVIYHLHEVSVSPAPLRWFLVAVARFTADRLIYVSDFHRESLPIPHVSAVTVHNSLDEGFLQRAAKCDYVHRRDGVFNVLMLASLRDYKGVPELMQLAREVESRPDIHFHLVVNDDNTEIHRYFQGNLLPQNLKVYPRTSDPGAFYARASLVLNLSRPDQWIETFGLTLLEAMAYGVPVIAPPVGGPVELVRDGHEGFFIDSRDSVKLASRVLQLADDLSLCLNLSSAGRARAADFSPSAFAQALRNALHFDSFSRP